ncbi:mannan endo-1,6-alpha-mannosidase DCW1 [Magnaporthiopsis poae ATCC 64411]|uniref:Mannan endo-1,6-alpha-mannosidase n=1 Tax=Magnaporthiopsis poae (strain ATCC 64411 / 73-15) TaxID=644358 RepID=A0A0C4DZP6_MAGP6|nr:mannan endo-1,6-alpha-mannosidase DCW1 [Magnaporthiopsis poae ATCC 64411]
MLAPLARVGATALLAGGLVDAAYSIANTADIKTTAASIAADLMAYYKGNLPGQVPGILPGPPPAGDYYWWEGGALMGQMIEYWHLTGDTTYNDQVMQGMLHQVGQDRDYQPSNYTASLGNDDQGFWGMSAMTAAELNFPNPPKDQPQWLSLAQAVFNTQAAPGRHDNTCGGGLRWQIPPTNNGYDYKNSIANGCFFNLGARLARYTLNTTYADWAEKQWDWITSVGLMDSQYAVYDGGHIAKNCTDINKAQFSYNNAVWLLGAAHMYNYTGGSEKWRARVEGLLDATLKTFFPDDVAYEIACETGNTCTTDMLSFKGYLHRWLSTATRIAPFIHDKTLAVLRKSTAAAVETCTGGDNKRTCGFKWSTKAFDGSVGAGQQMNVLGAVTSLLIDDVSPPLTNATGGTSIGDPNAGTHSTPHQVFAPITDGDRAGAAFLTIAVLGGAAFMFGWMNKGH